MQAEVQLSWVLLGFSDGGGHLCSRCKSPAQVDGPCVWGGCVQFCGDQTFQDAETEDQS